MLHAEALPLELQHRPPLQLPLLHWLDEEHCPPSLTLLTHRPPDRYSVEVAWSHPVLHSSQLLSVSQLAVQPLVHPALHHSSQDEV